MRQQTVNGQTEEWCGEQPLLEYRNVTVCRNGRTVLDGVTLCIGSGEHVAVLGPNGAGKSFLIRTITRECYPHSGIPGSYVRILGRETWNVFELRSLLGIVSSDLLAACTRSFTARQTILSGFFSSIGVWRHHQVTAGMEEKVRQVMGLMEIAHLAGRKMNEISTGEARRVLIGRALVHDPATLLLDEPSASLDFHAAVSLRNILRKIAAAGTSVIVVTHNLADVLPEVSRVVFLKEGRIFADGPKENLLISAALSRLFDIPLEVVRKDGYYHLW